MRRGHHIHRQSLILDAPDLKPQDGWYDRLARLQEFRILPALEHSLDQADDGSVRLIDRLEIEVTIANAERLEAEVARQIQAQLSKALAVPSARTSPQHHARFDQLLDYLHTGNLPWGAASGADLRELVRSWLAAASEWEWTLLFRAWRKSPAVFLGRCTQVQCNWEGESWQELTRRLADDPESSPVPNSAPKQAAAWQAALERLFSAKTRPKARLVCPPETDPIEEVRPEHPSKAETPSPPAWHPANAGIVILHPYLDYLLRQVDCDDLPRAATLFHYLVHGSADCSEWDLPLTKVLLGLHPDDFLEPAMELAPSDRVAADELLKGVIGHWAVLKNTGIHAFRDAFLLRSGALSWHAPGWRLTVEEKPQDLLLERLPWSIRLVRSKRMRQTLHVDWR
ncbi:hypothetical protein CLV84_0874 [Neolewinella xylanilytica]|uniref:Uncharacterized protein n=1 Tax=Neolewinella xylanilytica TaxID=1514080 RepID=A0A2S6I8U9_9BACT|nr:contractile injection system tape measure protein [Neolewinella xylanilytica]PPK87915.1 hypothetical protein CLV84_0874 [Neolewinella xylanilytica]